MFVKSTACRLGAHRMCTSPECCPCACHQHPSSAGPVRGRTDRDHGSLMTVAGRSDVLESTAARPAISMEVSS